ncbi:DUF3800 domain-containing protein [bacterium]|nr:DUF3800 domain-containing protein [bacterium]
MTRLLKKAIDWQPAKNSLHGNNQKIFLNYIIKNHQGFKNVISIKSLLRKIRRRLNKSYKKESFQHNIIVPLREDPNVFIGTSSKGIFLVVSAEDANVTSKFYSHRIYSEEKHWRNLRIIARKHKLFENYSSDDSNDKRSYVFFDESGTPSLNDSRYSPFFIVSAVIFDSVAEIKELNRRFKFLRALLHKNENFEFKSNDLSKKELKNILKTIDSVDYTFATICFIKKSLTGKGFNYPKSFYKYAYQILIDRVLTYVGEANLYFDEYGDPKFKNEFFRYIKKRSLGFPISKIHDMKMVESHEKAGTQLADLIAGVVKNKEQGKFNLLELVEVKMRTEISYFYKKP